MSFRKGAPRRRRVATAAIAVGALAAFQALAIVGAGSAAASGICTYSLSEQKIEITIDAGTSSTVTVDDGSVVANNAILFDGAACGSANTGNTTQIEVLGQPSSDEGFTIDNFTFDKPFPASISWFVDLGTGTADNLVILGSDSVDDVITATNTSFDMNGGVGTVAGVDELTVIGFDGNDTIDASATSIFNVLVGDDDDDVILPGTGAGDVAVGQAGIDTLSYGGRTTNTAVVNGVLAGADANSDGDSADVGDEGDTIDCFEVIQTGTANDTIVANGDGCGATAVTAVPGDGDDNVVGDGNDTIDWSSSSAGMLIDVPNLTATGQGTDTWTGITNFVGSNFDDTLLTDGNAPGPAVSNFSGLDGVDTVDGSAETSVFISLDALDPSDPNDDLENAIGSPGNDRLVGNDNDNVLTGNDGNDDLLGTPGRDNLDGGAGDDFLDGGDSNDVLLGGTGDDEFFGGLGADTVSFSSNTVSGVTVDLSLGFASSGDSGDDSFDDVVEIVQGSPFNDHITGGPFGGGGTVNFLFKGGAGKDVLTGFNGNDTLNGGGGKDTLRGVGGDDTLNGKGGNDLLAGGGGFDIGNGGNGKDVCKGVEQKHSCGTSQHPAAPQSAVGRRD